MAAKRIVYIDLLKGLSITWMVWFHTIHPNFVEFGFRMPLFFIASGIFFKAYPIKDFIEKKTFQLVIPFILFYLIYYAYLIVCVWHKHIIDFDYSCFWEIFYPYSGNGGPTVNPPLWFISALLNLQILLYVGSQIIKNRLLLMSLAFVLSVYANMFMFDTETYFQFGRALRYLCYYAFGYLFGRDIIKLIEKSYISLSILFICSLFSFLILMYGKEAVDNSILTCICEYIQITALVIAITCIFKVTRTWAIWKPLKYYGANSYIVLGMNEIILSTLRGWFTKYFGPLNLYTGMMHWIITLLLLIIVIESMNKYIPWLIGKKNPFRMQNTILRVSTFKQP